MLYVPVRYSLGDVVDVGTGGTGEPVAGVQPFLYLKGTVLSGNPNPAFFKVNADPDPVPDPDVEIYDQII